MAETCIFLNLGLSVFGFTGHFHWAFICFAFLASLIGRAMSIYPISFLYNWSLMENTEGPRSILDCRTIDACTSMDMEEVNERISESVDENIRNYEAAFSTSTDKDSMDKYPTDKDHVVRRTPERRLDKVIPVKFMHFLWFAGLRGAVAYAWCVNCQKNASWNRSLCLVCIQESMRCTLFIVLTIFSFLYLSGCRTVLVHNTYRSFFALLPTYLKVHEISLTCMGTKTKL